MYFPFSKPQSGGKRFAAQPQTIYSEFPKLSPIIIQRPEDFYNKKFLSYRRYLTNTVVIQTNPAAWAVAMANVANSYKSSFISVFLPSFFIAAFIISPGKVE